MKCLSMHLRSMKGASLKRLSTNWMSSPNVACWEVWHQNEGMKNCDIRIPPSRNSLWSCTRPPALLFCAAMSGGWRELGSAPVLSFVFSAVAPNLAVGRWARFNRFWWQSPGWSHPNLRSSVRDTATCPVLELNRAVYFWPGSHFNRQHCSTIETFWTNCPV